MNQTKIYSGTFGKYIFIVFFSLFFFTLISSDYSYNNNKVVTRNNSEIPDCKTLTKESLRLELDINHIICPEQVYAQVMIESSHLNSYLTKRTNNVIGMRYPFKRNTSAIGIFLPEENLIIKGTQEDLKKYRNKNNYAVYKNWEDCIKDYKLWQDRSFKLTEAYLTFLGNTYAEDPHYVKKIRSIAK